MKRPSRDGLFCEPYREIGIAVICVDLRENLSRQVANAAGFSLHSGAAERRKLERLRSVTGPKLTAPTPRGAVGRAGRLSTHRLDELGRFDRLAAAMCGDAAGSPRCSRMCRPASGSVTKAMA